MFPYLNQIQRAFGRHDVRQSRAHQGPRAAALARSIGARAYTVGDHVGFAGSPDLHTAAHEAAHVVQQRAGINLSGGIGQQWDQYEQHADAVAARVVQGRSAESLLDQHVGNGSRERGLQRFAFVNQTQITTSAKGFTPAMTGMVSDTVVRNYTGIDEFKKHAAQKTDYLGNLANGTWVRFNPTGTNLLGEDHTQTPLEKVLPAVGSKSFIYEPFSSDALKAGSNIKSTYEGENQALFTTFGVEKVKDKQQFGAESLLPKMGFGLTLAMPYFEGKKTMLDLDPNGYFGQPLQRYLKIAWAHSKDNQVRIAQQRKAKQKVSPKADALATVHGSVTGKIDTFITSLIADGHLETELDKPANAGLKAPIGQFARAFSDAMVEMAATEKSSRLTPAERKALSGPSTPSDADKVVLFANWRNFLFEDNVKAATKRGVRYAGMGWAHLEHLMDIGLDSKQHPFDMQDTGTDMKAFRTLTDNLKKIATTPVASPAATPTKAPATSPTKKP